MSLRALLPGFLLLMSGTGFAQDAKEPSYQDILARVKKMDPKADFTGLRMAYTQTPNYKPYDDDRESRDQLRGAFGDKEYQKAVEQAEKLLSKNYVDIEAHRVAASAHAELKNDKQAKFHAYVRDGLVQSILKSGDGKGPKTAYVVIATTEEYALMHARGVKTKRQALTGETGHKYDVHQGVDDKDQPVTLYFNIDRPFQWLANSLKPKE
jgi:hypothetical protein